MDRVYEEGWELIGIVHKSVVYFSDTDKKSFKRIRMRGLKAHQKLPADWNEREKLREKGQFWTPYWVAEAMVSYVAQDTEALFDPATGKGSFFDALIKLNRPNISYFGTDVDPEVLTEDIYS